MRSVKVTIILTRDDGIEERHTLNVAASMPVTVDDSDDDLVVDEAQENERLGEHLSDALSPTRLTDWLDALDELPDLD